MWRKGPLKLDTSLLLGRSTAVLLSFVDDEHGLLAVHPTILAFAPPALVRADARPFHSLPCFHKRWWGQRLEPPHSLHRLLLRWWGQILAPPHSLHMLLLRWCGHFQGSWSPPSSPSHTAASLPPRHSPQARLARAASAFPAGPGPELTSEPWRARLSVDAPDMLLTRTRNLLSSPRSVHLSAAVSSPQIPHKLALSLALTRSLTHAQLLRSAQGLTSTVHNHALYLSF
jgi:hypothetical protein